MTTEATWTPERVHKLRGFIAAGLTCSQIAAEIGVSRNAVIGKIHRLGLSPGRRPAGIAKQTRARPAGAPQTGARAQQTRLARILNAVVAETNVVPIRITGDVPPVESVQRCSLLDLAGGTCRWPLGDPGKADFGFCGNAAIGGISYCAGHARLAYRLPSGRRAQGSPG